MPARVQMRYSPIRCGCCGPYINKYNPTEAEAPELIGLIDKMKIGPSPLLVLRKPLRSYLLLVERELQLYHWHRFLVLLDVLDEALAYPVVFF